MVPLQQIQLQVGFCRSDLLTNNFKLNLCDVRLFLQNKQIFAKIILLGRNCGLKFG